LKRELETGSHAVSHGSAIEDADAEEVEKDGVLKGTDYLILMNWFLLVKMISSEHGRETQMKKYNRRYFTLVKDN